MFFLFFSLLIFETKYESFNITKDRCDGEEEEKGKMLNILHNRLLDL